jgi:hypothetical protein
MRFSLAPVRFIAPALLAVLLAACGGRAAKPDDVVQSAEIPSSFDVTVLADKDNQFDLEGAPLTSEDLKSAFRYRQEERLPMATVILKRGEKQKVKNEHVIAFARIAYEMKFKAFVEEKDGTISQVLAKAHDDK